MPLKALTPVQIDYYNDKHRFLIVSAGRRGRKTLIGGRRVLRDGIKNESNKYFLGAPTYMQSKNIFWRRLLNDTYYLRKDVSRSELVVTLKNDTEIAVVGLDRPERIEGQEWNGCHITEFANLKSSAWDENIRPALADTKGFAVLDGVPEGRDHYYERALYSCDNAIPETRPLHGAFHDCKQDDEWAFYTWFSADVLEKSEIDHAKQQLDARTYRQEYEGSFESYAGIAYYEFGQHNFKDIFRDFEATVHVGMDFNVNPMTAVLCHIKGDMVYQWGEIWLEQSNTFEMSQHLLKYVDYPGQVIIFPDATGEHESSNATISDLAILRKAGFKIRANPQNPYIVDRVNAVNSLLKDRGNKTRYYINPRNCPKTINDFNKRVRTDDGRLDKQQEKEDMVGHISDGLGYLIAFNFPVRERTYDYTRRY